MTNNGDRRKIAYITTDDRQRLLVDPENPSNPHICVPVNSAIVEATQLVQQAVEAAQITGVAPKRAYQQMVTAAVTQFAADHQFRDAVKDQLPYKRVKSSLNRAANVKIPTINDIDAIPNNLKMTLEGELSEDPADPVYREIFLRHQSVDPPCLIFASNADLQVMTNTY